MTATYINGAQLADKIVQQLCECGCGRVYVTLLDAQDNGFACFTLPNENWIPFAEDCVRRTKGEVTFGPPPKPGELN